MLLLTAEFRWQQLKYMRVTSIFKPIDLLTECSNTIVLIIFGYFLCCVLCYTSVFQFSGKKYYEQGRRVLQQGGISPHSLYETLYMKLRALLGRVYVGLSRKIFKFLE